MIMEEFDLGVASEVTLQEIGDFTDGNVANPGEL
jgi:hypothetical protein